MKKQKNKQLKQVQNQAQEGRSMVEMLGVLAIIAILSIGGIVGYKLAMNYYQADQIANEINLMRTDLKVKYALGNEELLLGDPYDDTPENEHYSGHLSTQYNRYPVDYDCIRKDKAEFYNCRETDAYYIKVANVSKGVCKPLVTLLNGMDGLMYIEINKQPYEDDLCSSGENNEIYVEFDAEEVNGNYDSNRPEGWCADDEDCDASRPICDVANHECVECIDNMDCADSTRPRCNVEQGSCESCPPEKPKWNGNTCVECITSADCKNSEKPQCNTTTNQCVECVSDQNCIEKDTNNPICNTDTNTCEPCPEGQKWQETVQKCGVGECESNDDCNNGRTGYYCYLERGFNCNSEFNPNAFGEGKSGYASTCRLVEEDIEEKEVNGHTYYFSKTNMTWWTASERLCQQALNSKELTLDDLDCAGMKAEDLCKTEARKELYRQFQEQVYVWLDGGYASCRAYLVNLWHGYVDDDARHDDYYNTDGHALCVRQ